MTSLIINSILIVTFLIIIITPYQLVKCPNDNNTYPRGTTCDFPPLGKPHIHTAEESGEDKDNKKDKKDDDDKDDEKDKDDKKKGDKKKD